MYQKNMILVLIALHECVVTGKNKKHNIYCIK